MPTIKQLLDTIDATYRNSYSPAQKVAWMDTAQRQIYQKVPKESVPYEFSTVADFSFYAIPEDCDRSGIKQVTIERMAGRGHYITLPYVSVESTQQVSATAQFYSVLQDNFFINPMPTEQSAGRKVIVIYNSRPATLSALNLGAIPELEEDFQELLVLGVLERIARARGEIDDKNNFAADYNMLLRDYENQYKLRQPEYYSVADKMPGPRRGGYGARRYGRTSVSDLIPPGLM